MLKLKDILNKINSLENDYRLHTHSIDDIIVLDFYSDESGSIHTTECQFFEFDKISELKEFVKLSNEYIIMKRKNYPL